MVWIYNINVTDNHLDLEFSCAFSIFHVSYILNLLMGIITLKSIKCSLLINNYHNYQI